MPLDSSHWATVCVEHTADGDGDGDGDGVDEGDGDQVLPAVRNFGSVTLPSLPFATNVRVSVSLITVPLPVTNSNLSVSLHPSWLFVSPELSA